MKTLINWSLTLGLIASPLISTCLIQPVPVLALPQSEIVGLLSGIPVFSLLNAEGSPIARQVEDNKTVIPVFMSQKDAQQLLNQLKQQSPDIGNLYTVQVLPLGTIYDTVRKSTSPNKRLLLQYIPTVTETEAAKKVASDNGQEYRGDVPLYLVRMKSDRSYLTIEKDNKQVVPVFFERATVQEWIETVKKSKPDLAAEISIELVSLSDLIANLEQQDNALLKNIRFWPSEEMMQVIRANQKNPQNQR
ncbi:Tic22 family protein [Crocosphaera sp. XPORK-15E]|uniref:Tic22 family protein n=1 Tax=Crocosphaera sp. XPORK-15E TaxID=3110247 RepID=UPI002B1ECDDF|nr:Tic22 family protein [Crocosphaera sp. XPORK-15E]MEA5533285.1 Tic22 family protein [Crocosphaera sp. XPORK-15E]